MGDVRKAIALQARRAAASAYVAEFQCNGLRTPEAVSYAARQFRVSESTIWRWRDAYFAERIARNYRRQQGQG